MKACVFPGCGAYGDGTAATQQANRLSRTRDGQAFQASPAGQSKSREGGRGGPSGKHLDGVELEVDACFKVNCLAFPFLWLLFVRTLACS